MVRLLKMLLGTVEPLPPIAFKPPEILVVGIVVSGTKELKGTRE